MSSHKTKTEHSRLLQFSSIAAAVLVATASANVNAKVLLKGTMTINGEAQVIEGDASNVTIGKPGDEIKIEKKSGDSLYVNKATLTVDGSKIDIEGYTGGGSS